MAISSGYPTGAKSRDDYLKDYGKLMQTGKKVNRWAPDYPNKDIGKQVIGKVAGFKVYKDIEGNIFYYYAANRVDVSDIQEIEERLGKPFEARNDEPEYVISESVASSEVTVDIPKGKEPVAGYIERLSQALRSEQDAINEYTAVLQEPSLPQEVRDTVSEILEDEKDHMVLIASLLSEEIQTAFPNNTDELEAKKAVKESVDVNQLSVSIEKLSTDEFTQTSTYRVVSDVESLDETAVAAAIDMINNNESYEVSLTDMNRSILILTVKIEYLSIELAKSIVATIIDMSN